MKAVNVAAWSIVAALLVVLLIEARSLLRPLAIAIVVTFLINSLANFFQSLSLARLRMPRWMALIFAFVTIFGFLSLCIEIIIRNVNNMALSSAEYQVYLEDMGDHLLQGMGLDNAPSVGHMISEIDLKPLLANLGTGLSNFAGKFLLMIVYVVFLLLEQGLFKRKFRLLFDEEEDFKRAEETLRRISESVRTYLSVKAFTSLLTGVLCYVALTFIGLKFAVFWAFIIFLFNFIPNIGSWVSTALPVLFAAIQFGEPSYMLTTLVAVAGIQLAIGNYLDPRLMGRTLNISPLMVLLSLVVWGAIWGVFGMFLSVPITVTFIIIATEIPATRKVAMFLSQKGELGGRKREGEKGQH